MAMIETKDTRADFRLKYRQKLAFQAAAERDGMALSQWLRWLGQRRVAEQATRELAGEDT